MRKLTKNLSYYNKIATFALITTSILIFAPITQNTNSYTLTNGLKKSFHLSLLNDSNYSFQLNFPCQLRSLQNTWLIEFFGGAALRFEINSNNSYLLIGHRSENNIKVLTFERPPSLDIECREKIKYLSEENKILYFVGQDLVSTKYLSKNYKIQLNKVVKFNPAIKDNLLQLDILNSSIIPINKLRIMILFTFLLLTLFLNFSKIKKYVFVGFKKVNEKKIFTSAFIAIIILISVIELPRGDDGWYLLINKYFYQTHFYDNYIFSSPRPNGYLYNSLQTLITNFNLVILFRLIPIVLTIITLILVLVTIKSFKSKQKYYNSFFQFIFFILILIYLASFNTLRPEIVISFIYILNLIIVIKIHKNNFYQLVSLSILLIGVALSTHQQALILIFAPLVHLIQFCIYKPIFTQKSFLFLSIGFSTSAQLIFIQGNIFWLKKAIDTFTNAANNASPGRFLNNYPLYAEWIRPYHLYFSGLSTQPQIFLGTLLFIVSLFLIFTSYKLFKINTLKFSNIHFLIISLSLAPFGLFLSPIKWSWYYAPLFINIIFAYFILNFTKIYQNNFKKILAQILAIGFSASLAFTYDWRANDFNWPLRYVTSSELNSKYWLIFGSSKSAIMWIVLTIIALVLVYYLKNNSFEIQLKVLNIFTIFIIITLSVIHLSPPVIDAIKNPHEWTFVKQSVVGIWDKKARCGLASTIKDQETGKPIQQLLDENNWTVVSMPAPYIFIPCANPVLTEAGSWLMPDVSFGWVPVYDHQRLATETDIKLMGCDESLQTEDAAQKCFYKWDTKIKNLPPYTTKVVYYPDYGQILEKINPFK